MFTAMEIDNRAGPNESGPENGNNNDERLQNFNDQHKIVADPILIKEEPFSDWYNYGLPVVGGGTPSELSNGNEQFEDMMNPNYLLPPNFTSGLLSESDDDNFEMVSTAEFFNLQQPEHGVNENRLCEHCGSLTEGTNDSGGTTGRQLTLVTANQVQDSVFTTVNAYFAKPGISTEAKKMMNELLPLTLTKKDKNKSQIEPTSYKKLTESRPRQRKAPKQPVADAMKDQAYLDKRLQNTLAARRCRQKKRELDDQRDALIKQLMAEKEQLTQKFVELSKEAETCKRLKEENSLLKQLVQSNLTKKSKRASKKI